MPQRPHRPVCASFHTGSDAWGSSVRSCPVGKQTIESGQSIVGNAPGIKRGSAPEVKRDANMRLLGKPHMAPGCTIIEVRGPMRMSCHNPLATGLRVLTTVLICAAVSSAADRQI